MFCNATITSMMLDWLILIPNFGLGMRRVPWPETREMEGKGEGGKVVRERELRGEGSSEDSSPRVLNSFSTLQQFQYSILLQV